MAYVLNWPWSEGVTLTRVLAQLQQQ